MIKLIFKLGESANLYIMEPFQFISQLAELPDDKLPLLKAALGIALVEYPELDIEEELRKFDSIIVAASGFESSP